MLFLVQTWFYLRSGSSSASVSDHHDGAPRVLVNADRAMLASMAPLKRVAIVVPLFRDHAQLLTRRFKAWNGKRSPCVGE